MKPTLGLLSLLIFTTNLVAAPPREAMDEAISRGLVFLKQNQQNDGSWPIAGGGGGGFGRQNFGGGNGSGDPAVTSLAVMAFMSAGHVPGEGKYGKAIELGIRYVMSTQHRNGLFSAPQSGGTEMYVHGICCLMLAEAAGMTEGKVAEELRQRLEAGITVILAGQRKVGAGRDAGGWRYRIEGSDADLSVTGWQLMALRGSRNLGCDVPLDRIKAAVEYVQRCHDPISGGYRYMTNSQVTVPCTGTGILAMELCGKEYHRSPEALKAGSYVLKSPLHAGSHHFFYGVYYTSQGMFQLGDNYWKSYRTQLHALLLRSNPPRNDGAWYGGGGFDDTRFGPSYCTSMAILALTVEYRYLPIYQRFEEPVEKDANDP